VPEPRDRQEAWFSDHARRSLDHALREAQRHAHPNIGTEHLLLGLIAISDGAALQVLQGLQTDGADVRRQVERVLGYGERPVSGQLEHTPRTKRAIELALDEARRLDDAFVGPEHLLLGLAREGEGVAAYVLAGFNANPERLREEIAAVRSVPGWKREP
jgi:ATP-dependent Clp protease ATP-binding subunit ClpC